MFILTFLDTDRLASDLVPAHMTTARTIASARAQRSDRDIVVHRIIGMTAKPTLIARADGSFDRPPGSQPVSARDDCKRSSGQTCFCDPCRARRAAA